MICGRPAMMICLKLISRSHFQLAQNSISFYSEHAAGLIWIHFHARVDAVHSFYDADIRNQHTYWRNYLLFGFLGILWAPSAACAFIALPAPCRWEVWRDRIIIITAAKAKSKVPKSKALLPHPPSNLSLSPSLPVPQSLYPCPSHSPLYFSLSISVALYSSFNLALFLLPPLPPFYLARMLPYRILNSSFRKKSKLISKISDEHWKSTKYSTQMSRPKIKNVQDSKLETM